MDENKNFKNPPYENEYIIVTVFDFSGFWNQFFALTFMGVLPFFLRYKGLLFSKLMGVGGGNGFSISPDFSKYVLLSVWESEESSKKVFNQKNLLRTYALMAKNKTFYQLLPVRVSGTWGGQNPFHKIVEADDSLLVAVITRATIKWKDMFHFWKNVPEVSQKVFEQKGLITAFGIGEWPLRFQATFSVWESESDLLNYAYKNKQHDDMIKKTRQTGWYKEEMFARFRVKNIFFTGW